jgi:two-component system, NarL family, sensor histidine kinase UhpB
VDQVGERVPAVDALGGRLLADGPMVVCRGLLDDPSTWRFSANAERVLGWPADSPDGLATWLERMHPDDRDGFEAAVGRVFSGEADRVEAHLRLRQADGEYRWIWTLMRAERDDATGQRYLVAYDLDVTDRMLAEERARRQNQELQRRVHDRATELENTNATLRAVLEGIADPVYVKDADGRYVLVNSAAAGSVGLRPEEYVGRTDHELFPADVAGHLRADDREVTAAGAPRRFRETLDTPEGARVYQAVKAPWRDAAGRVLGVVGVSRDVTEQERVEAERRRLLERVHDVQEEERRHIAIDLHDGPVQGLAMLGYKLARTRVLLEAGETAPALALVGECEADVAGEVEALRRTLRDLRPLVLDQHGLEVALHDHAHGVRKRAGLASCRVTARLGGRRLNPATETALFRVAQQALTNVADHAGASRVEVLLERSATGEVLLKVIDDGCGFDPSHVQPAGPQLGFGLTSMRERAEAVGGRLTIRTAPGAGTTVEVRVP